MHLLPSSRTAIWKGEPKSYHAFSSVILSIFHGANFLDTGQGGFDAAIPNEVGHLIAKQRLALGGRTAKFTLSHYFVLLFQPASCKYSSSRGAQEARPRKIAVRLRASRPYFP